MGIPRTTFYRWYDRYHAFGLAGLEDRDSGPGRVWNRIPDDVYFGRGRDIIERRKEIKELTIRNRRLLHQRNAA